MTTLNPLSGTLQHADTDTVTGTGNTAERRDQAPSFGSAVAALLKGAEVGSTATAPGDRWLVLQIEEVLRGFADIQHMANGGEPAPPTRAGDTSAVLIRAPRARAPEQPGRPYSETLRSLYLNERKGELT